MNPEPLSHLDDWALTEVAAQRSEQVAGSAAMRETQWAHARTVYLLMLLCSVAIMGVMYVDMSSRMRRVRTPGSVAHPLVQAAARPGPVPAQASGQSQVSPGETPMAAATAIRLVLPGVTPGPAVAPSPSAGTKATVVMSAPALAPVAAAPAGQLIAGLPQLGAWPRAIVTVGPEAPPMVMTPDRLEIAPNSGRLAGNGSGALTVNATPSDAVPSPDLPATGQPNHAMSAAAIAPAAPPQAADPSAIAAPAHATKPVETSSASDTLARIVARMAAAEAELQSGQIVVTVQYSNGSQTSSNIDFDFHSLPQRSHLHTVYLGSTGPYTIDQVVIGEQVWLSAVRGLWCWQPSAGAPLTQVRAYLPHITSVAQLQLNDAAKRPVLAWADVARGVDVTLTFDRITGIPQEMHQASRMTGTTLIVRYAGWNTSVDISQPVHTDAIPRCGYI